MVQSVEMREGTLLYSDPHRSGARALGVLTVAALYADDNPIGPGQSALTPHVGVAWHSDGYVPAALDALAFFFASNPGVKEIFDGMYAARQRLMMLMKGPS